MSTLSQTSGALAARVATLNELAAAGIDATGDAGAAAPGVMTVLVGLPSLLGRGQASTAYSVPVTVISGDPLNTDHAVERLYALADDVAFALRIAEYRPGSFTGGVNAEPLPAIELAANVTLAHTNGG